MVEVAVSDAIANDVAAAARSPNEPNADAVAAFAQALAHVSVVFNTESDKDKQELWEVFLNENLATAKQKLTTKGGGARNDDLYTYLKAIVYDLDQLDQIPDTVPTTTMLAAYEDKQESYHDLKEVVMSNRCMYSGIYIGKEKAAFEKKLSIIKKNFVDFEEFFTSRMNIAASMCFRREVDETLEFESRQKRKNKRKVYDMITLGQRIGDHARAPVEKLKAFLNMIIREEESMEEYEEVGETTLDVYRRMPDEGQDAKSSEVVVVPEPVETKAPTKQLPMTRAERRWGYESVKPAKREQPRAEQPPRTVRKVIAGRMVERAPSPEIDAKTLNAAALHRLQLAREAREIAIRDIDGEIKRQARTTMELADKMQQLFKEADDMIDMTVPLLDDICIAWTNAMSAIERLSIDDLLDIRRLDKPPRKITDPVCLLFKHPPTWESFLSFSKSSSFIDELTHFDVSSIQPQIYRQVKAYTTDKAFSEISALREKSVFAAAIALWTLALVKRVDSHELIEENRSKIIATMRDVREAERRLDAAKETLRSLQAKQIEVQGFKPVGDEEQYVNAVTEYEELVEEAKRQLQDLRDIERAHAREAQMVWESVIKRSKDNSSKWEWAQESRRALKVENLLQVRNLARLTPSMRSIVEPLCLVMGKKQNLNGLRELLADGKFDERMASFDRDSVPESTFLELRCHVTDPFKESESWDEFVDWAHREYERLRHAYLQKTKELDVLKASKRPEALRKMKPGDKNWLHDKKEKIKMMELELEPIQNEYERAHCVYRGYRLAKRLQPFVSFMNASNLRTDRVLAPRERNPYTLPLTRNEALKENKQDLVITHKDEVAIVPAEGPNDKWKIPLRDIAREDIMLAISMDNPPPIVRKICEAVSVILGTPPEWHYFQRHANDSRFIDRLNTTRRDMLPNSTVKELRDYCTDPFTNPNTLSEATPFFTWGARWLIGLEQNSAAASAAYPYRLKVKEAQQKVGFKEDEIRELMSELRKRESRLEDARRVDPIELERQIAMMKTKITGYKADVEIAEKLLGGTLREENLVLMTLKPQLDASRTSWNAALTALNTLASPAYYQLLEISNPDANIMQVALCVVLLFDKEPDYEAFLLECAKDLDKKRLTRDELIWQTARTMISQNNFLKSLQTFRGEQVDELTLRRVENIVKNNVVFQRAEILRDQSVYASALALWVTAVVERASVSIIAEPKRWKRQRAEKQLDLARKQYQDAVQQIAVKEDQLARADGSGPDNAAPFIRASQVRNSDDVIFKQTRAQ